MQVSRAVRALDDELTRWRERPLAENTTSSWTHATKKSVWDAPSSPVPG